jgi:hypothetical protein
MYYYILFPTAESDSNSNSIGSEMEDISMSGSDMSVSRLYRFSVYVASKTMD